MQRIGYSGGIQLLVTSNPRFSVDINSIIDGKRNDDDDDDECVRRMKEENAKNERGRAV